MRPPRVAPDPHLPLWERRFRAGRTALPTWAVESTDRCAVVASQHGVLEVHSWRPGQQIVPLTARRDGTAQAQIDQSGEWIWWFDDAIGSERGTWRRQRFGSSPGNDIPAVPGLKASYPAGLALGPGGLAAIGQNDDSYGTRLHLFRPGQAPRLLYAHAQDAAVGSLSADGSMLAIAHSEHGDTRHPAVRILRTDDGTTVAELWDGPGRGLDPLAFSPVTGDDRIMVRHERRGHGEVVIWDPRSGEQTELDPGVPGEAAWAHWFQDAGSVLIAMDHQARTRLHAVDLADGSTCPMSPADGTATAATTRPDGGIWTLWSSAEQPALVRDRSGAQVLSPPGRPAPRSVPVEDIWVDGPGGRIHALLRRPGGADEPMPLIIDVHGGPTAHDGDWFRAYPSAWVDHGFAVLQVNYRGSTGYGSAWRDALQERVGHVELEDIVAVRDHLVSTGVAAADRIVLAGASWGGYLTLLGLGLHPDRWAVGVAAVPVADYSAAYEDEMEALRSFDRSLFGGSPQEVPQRYRDSSPITYVDRVRSPVLILAGRNDPRCPIRQIENYVSALAERGCEHEVYRYDAGHGSLVDDERVRQVRAEISFVLRHLPAQSDIRTL